MTDNAPAAAEGVTAETAPQALVDFKADGEKLAAYLDAGHPGHRKALQDVTAIHAAMAGGSDAAADTKVAQDGAHVERGDGVRLAVPGGPAGYRIDVPQGVERDAAMEAWSRGLFHRGGFAQPEAARIVAAYNHVGAQPPDDAAVAAEGKRAETRLRAEWGAAFEDRLAAAKVFLGEVGGAEALHLMTRTGLGNNLAVIRDIDAAARRRRA